MKRFYFHSIAIPVSFVLYLYGMNINKVAFQDTLLTLAVVIGLAGLLYLFFKLIGGSWEKASVLTSLFFLLFFNLDSITKSVLVILKNSNPNTATEANIATYCLVGLGIFFGIILSMTLISKKEPRKLNRMANIFSIGMLAISCGSLLTPAIQKLSGASLTPEANFAEKWQNTLKSEPDLLQSKEQLPDIYYIILDGYGRADVLEQLYGFDNSPFLGSITDLGFMVADDSLANYKQTILSIPSALNMDYITMFDPKNTSVFDQLPLFNIIEHNRVFEQLDRLGYRVDAFASGLSLTEIEAADRNYHPAFYPNEFEMLVVNTTPIGFLWNSQLHEIHRDRVRYALQNLAKAGQQAGPDFVFTHILSPHPPFVFGPNGESLTPDRPYIFSDASDFLLQGTLEEYRTGYINQISYLNQEVYSAIQEIFQNSSTPPIIIIQGDHGPGSQLDSEVLEKSNLAERYPILNAYYIPCDTGEILPVDITPVNSFRYVFNACFQAEIPYLKNRQFFSPNSAPFNMTDVTGQIVTGKQ